MVRAAGPLVVARHDRAGPRADRHPAFTRENPNRVRALVGTFSQANPLHFHDRSGDGYAFLAEEVIALDTINPTTAARLVQPLGHGAVTTPRARP